MTTLLSIKLERSDFQSPFYRTCLICSILIFMVSCDVQNDHASSLDVSQAEIGVGMVSAGDDAKDVVPAKAVTTEAIVLSMSVDQKALTAGKVIVNSEINNASNRDIRFLAWNTPFDNVLNAPVFNVFSGENQLPFQGRMVKRAPPMENDYIELLSGTKKTGSLNISNSYPFCKNTLYRLVFARDLLDPTSIAIDVQRSFLDFSTGSEFRPCDL